MIPGTSTCYSLLVSRNPPKARQAYQEWMMEANNTAAVALKVEEWWGEELKKGKTGQPNAEIWMAVTREIFQSLPTEVHDEWKMKAKDVADRNRAEYLSMLMAPPSKDPVQRQLWVTDFGYRDTRWPSYLIDVSIISLPSRHHYWRGYSTKWGCMCLCFWAV